MTRQNRLFHLSASFFALTLVFAAQLFTVTGSSLASVKGISVYNPAPLPTTHTSAPSPTPSRTTVEQRRLIRLKNVKKPVYRRATTGKATYIDTHETL